ncbi:hypothetical protein [Aquibacillus saliphilus]|uniref:hypothetical protein n=1 Tax=Aquibacillus saliphilus TaxID=1909422 RepID=UPI001CEFB70A|nr:hypothetical protein [Aquibacillus saliphilus]
MATSYEDVYARFLPKITDYSFLNMVDEDIQDYLEGYLKSSITKFHRYCNKLSDRDEDLKQFNKDLNDEEEEILSLLMCIEFLMPRILTDDLLKRKMSTKDYNIHSPAQHMAQLRELKSDFQKEIRYLITLYTFKKDKMDEFL